MHHSWVINDRTPTLTQTEKKVYRSCNREAQNGELWLQAYLDVVLKKLSVLEVCFLFCWLDFPLRQNGLLPATERCLWQAADWSPLGFIYLNRKIISLSQSGIPLLLRQGWMVVPLLTAEPHESGNFSKDLGCCYQNYLKAWMGQTKKLIDNQTIIHQLFPCKSRFVYIFFGSFIVL